MKPNIRTDEKGLIARAVEALIKELGQVTASRFLSLPKEKQAESVRRHRQWQAQLREEEFFGRVLGPRARESVAE